MWLAASKFSAISDSCWSKLQAQFRIMSSSAISFLVPSGSSKYFDIRRPRLISVVHLLRADFWSAHSFAGTSVFLDVPSASGGFCATSILCLHSSLEKWRVISKVRLLHWWCSWRSLSCQFSGVTPGPLRNTSKSKRHAQHSDHTLIYFVLISIVDVLRAEFCSANTS